MSSREPEIPTSKREVVRTIAEYRRDIAVLKEREKILLEKIKLLENLIPFAVVWYMWKMAIAIRVQPECRVNIEQDTKEGLSQLLQALEDLRREITRVKSEHDSVTPTDGRTVLPPYQQIDLTLKPGSHSLLSDVGASEKKSHKSTTRSGTTLSSKAPSKGPSQKSRSQSRTKEPFKSPRDDLSSSKGGSPMDLQPSSESSRRRRTRESSVSSVKAQPQEQLEFVNKDVPKAPTENIFPGEQDSKDVPQRDDLSSSERDSLSDRSRKSETSERKTLNEPPDLMDTRPGGEIEISAPEQALLEVYNPDPNRNMTEGSRSRSRIVREVIEIQRDGQPPERIEVQLGMGMPQMEAVEEMIRRLDQERDNLQQEMDRIFGPLPEAIARVHGGVPQRPDEGHSPPPHGEASPRESLRPGSRRTSSPEHCPDSLQPGVESPISPGGQESPSPPGEGTIRIPLQPGSRRPGSHGPGEERYVPPSPPGEADSRIPLRPGSGRPPSPGGSPDSTQPFYGQPPTPGGQRYVPPSPPGEAAYRIPLRPGSGRPLSPGGSPDSAQPFYGQPPTPGGRRHVTPSPPGEAASRIPLRPGSGRPLSPGGSPDSAQPFYGQPPTPGGRRHVTPSPPGEAASRILIRPGSGRSPSPWDSPDSAHPFYRHPPTPGGQRHVPSGEAAYTPVAPMVPFGRAPYGPGSPMGSPDSTQPGSLYPLRFRREGAPAVQMGGDASLPVSPDSVRHQMTPSPTRSAPPSLDNADGLIQRIENIEARLNRIAQAVELAQASPEQNSSDSDMEDFDERLRRVQDRVAMGLRRVQEVIEREMSRLNNL